MKYIYIYFLFICLFHSKLFAQNYVVPNFDNETNSYKYVSLISSLKRDLREGKTPTLIFPDGNHFTINSLAGEGSRSLILRTSTGRALRIPLSRGPFVEGQSWTYEQSIESFVDGQNELKSKGVDVPEVYRTQKLYYAEMEDVREGMNLDNFFTKDEYKHLRESPDFMARLENSLKKMTRSLWSFEKISDFHQGQIFCNPTGTRCRLIDFDKGSRSIKFQGQTNTPFFWNNFNYSFPPELFESLKETILKEREIKFAQAIDIHINNLRSMPTDTLIKGLDHISDYEKLGKAISLILEIDDYQISPRNYYEAPFEIYSELLKTPNLEPAAKEAVSLKMIQFAEELLIEGDRKAQLYILNKEKELMELLPLKFKGSFKNITEEIAHSCQLVSEIISKNNEQIQNLVKGLFPNADGYN